MAKICPRQVRVRVGDEFRINAPLAVYTRSGYLCWRFVIELEEFGFALLADRYYPNRIHQGGVTTSQSQVLIMDGPTSGAPSSHAPVNPTNTNKMPSEAANTTTNSSNRDMAWEWGECRDPLKKQGVWCKICGKKVGGGITRLKQHLTHTGGQVTGCTKVTMDVQKRVMASIKEKEKVQLEKKRNTEILRSNMVDLGDEDVDEEDQDDVQEIGVKRNVSKKKKFVGASNVRGNLDSVFKTDHAKTQQTTLDRNNPIKEKLKMVAWDKFATWAYYDGFLQCRT